MHNNQFLAFRSFEETIPVKLVAQWHATVELWEKDSNAPNPFKTEKRCKGNFLSVFFLITCHLGISEHLVQMKLAEEVEERDWDMSIDASSDEDHPSVVILNGLHLEDDQYVSLSLNALVGIDWKHLGGDSQKTLKGWGCIQRLSK